MALPLCSHFGKRIGKPSPVTIYKNDESWSERLQIMSGDRIIAVIDGILRCGVLHSRYPETEKSTELKMNVLWDGHSVTEVVHLNPWNFLILDRIFSVGQRVMVGPLSGTIISIQPTFSLQIHNSNHLILSDSPLKSIQPLTKLFHGVFIEYMGWFGQIAGVVRRIKVEFLPHVGCHIIRREPVVMRDLINDRPKKKNRERRRKRLLNRNYPYIINRSFPTSYISLPGTPIKFSGRNLSKVASCLDLEGFSIRGPELTGKVLSSEVDEISVDWFTLIPGFPKKPKPPMRVAKPELKKIHYFYIHPCRYFFKDGLCEYELQPTDDLIHVEEFQQHLSKTFDSRNPEVIAEIPEKKLRFETLDLQVSTKLVVHKHIIRHHFEVLVDGTDELKMVYGSDLWPCSNDDITQKQCQPPFFVRMKSSSTCKNNKYGVVLRQYKVDEKIVVLVQWLREKDGGVDLLQMTTVDFLDITGHKTYNELSVGTHVALANGIPDLDNDGFQFGTILFIDRFRYGRIHVYCSVDMTEKRMWPFQLQRIKYEQPRPTMKRVEKKFMCKEMPRILRGTDLQGDLLNPLLEDQTSNFKSHPLETSETSDVGSEGDSSESEEEVEFVEPKPRQRPPCTNVNLKDPDANAKSKIHVAQQESHDCIVID